MIVMMTVTFAERILRLLLFSHTTNWITVAGTCRQLLPLLPIWYSMTTMATKNMVMKQRKAYLSWNCRWLVSVCIFAACERHIFTISIFTSLYQPTAHTCVFSLELPLLVEAVGRWFGHTTPRGSLAPFLTILHVDELHRLLKLKTSALLSAF